MEFFTSIIQLPKMTGNIYPSCRKDKRKKKGAPDSFEQKMSLFQILIVLSRSDEE